MQMGTHLVCSELELQTVDRLLQFSYFLGIGLLISKSVQIYIITITFSEDGLWWFELLIQSGFLSTSILFRGIQLPLPADSLGRQDLRFRSHNRFLQQPLPSSTSAASF